MPPKPVDSRDNGQTAKTYGNPIGVECEACKRRALMPLNRLGNVGDNMRPLRACPFDCSACESREVALLLFAKRAEANAWANVATASGPSF